MLLELHKFYMRNVFIYHNRMPQKRQKSARKTKKSRSSKKTYNTLVAKNVVILSNFSENVFLFLSSFIISYRRLCSEFTYSVRM